jgi:hypothetical protein
MQMQQGAKGALGQNEADKGIGIPPGRDSIKTLLTRDICRMIADAPGRQAGQFGQAPGRQSAICRRQD